MITNSTFFRDGELVLLNSKSHRSISNSKFHLLSSAIKNTLDLLFEILCINIS